MFTANLWAPEQATGLKPLALNGSHSKTVKMGQGEKFPL